MFTTKSALGILPMLQNFVRPSEHSKFSPSAAERWLETGCSFSLEYTKNIPEKEEEYTKEGTVNHSVCEAYFYYVLFGRPFSAELKFSMLGYNADEMMARARIYVDVVMFWLKNKEVIGDVIWYGLEKGIPVFPEEECYGTGDCIIIGTKASVVIDYKNGMKKVSASSPQLKVYAAGIARHLINVPIDYKIYCVVVQPKVSAAPVEICYDMPTLNQFLGVIWSSIQKTKRKDLQPVEGNHCFWCPASRTSDVNLKCPAIKAKPLKIAQENFGQFMKDMNAPITDFNAPNIKRDEALIKIITLYPLMKKVYEDGIEELKLRLQENEAIAGVSLVKTTGNRKLNAVDDVQAAQMIRTYFPQLNPVKTIPATEKLMTLTEMESILGKNKLDSLCIRPITDKVVIMDEKMRNILGEMAAYGAMINNGNNEE